MSNHWQPSASIEVLRLRAKLLARLRCFFEERNVLEVETPLLCRYTVTDPHMDVISATNPIELEGRPYFLHTSPEYAMKRLLAAGSGPIFQICKTFRRGESGGRHNPEFTMLEWYRPGFDHCQLMAEVEQLVGGLLGLAKPFKRSSYRELFLRHLSVDPHRVDIATLRSLAHQNIDLQMQSDNRDNWLNLLLAEIIEPQLGSGVPEFVYDYPASQSSLARVAKDEQGIAVAQRFELYINGIELANGFNELTDAAEQRQRFEKERQRSQRDIDEYLLSALVQGLPDCAGVALGVDRLLMLMLGATTIEEVLSFAVGRA